MAKSRVISSTCCFICRSLGYRYAAKFGTKRLGDTRARKDKGTAKRRRDALRDGKETVAEFKRRRAECLLVPFGSGGGSRQAPKTNVFGHQALAVAKLQAMRKAAETEAFKRLSEKASAKLEASKAATDRAMRRETRLSTLGPSSLRTVRRKDAKRRAVALLCKIRGDVALGWRSAVRFLWGGQTPLVFVDRGWQGSLDKAYGGKPLREYLFQGTLAQYVQDLRSASRVVLVHDLQAIAPAVLLAARVLGARVQERLLVPALHFKPLMRQTLAVTAAFAMEQKLATKVIRVAAARAQQSGAHGVRLVTLPELTINHDTACVSKRARVPSASVLCTSACDAELATAPPGVKALARTVDEYLSSLGGGARQLRASRR